MGLPEALSRMWAEAYAGLERLDRVLVGLRAESSPMNEEKKEEGTRLRIWEERIKPTTMEEQSCLRGLRHVIDREVCLHRPHSKRRHKDTK